MPNCKNSFGSVEAELLEKADTISNAAYVYRQMLPGILLKLSKIKDCRQCRKIKHKLTTLMAYGILFFVYQINSRRQANREMAKDIFFENLKTMFPELETLPHADTLARLLENIKVSEIQECLIELVKDLIRKKKFRNYMVNKGFLIAVDGTQSFYRDYQWDEKCLERTVGKDEKTQQFYVYILDSVIVLNNGITLPFISEFLKNEDYVKGVSKQDCERKAFQRMAKRLKSVFRKTPVTIVLDGLYACGPIISICRKYGWDFMMVLKEDGLSELWNEALGLMVLETDNRLKVMWGDREQNYCWANDIEYEYEKDGRRKVIVHVVICYEVWEESHIKSSKKREGKETRYAWISSKPLNEKNLFTRCTKIARYRWKIEINILVEKHQGYQLEHCFSYTWNAMEGFHYLMKIGHFLNVMALNSEILHQKVSELGIRGFIKYLKEACSGSVIDNSRIEEAFYRYKQWRLIAA